MTKLKFLLSLHERLTGLPQEEAEERLRFYSEMIEDRMEEGLPEADAVAAVGSVEEIVVQILADLPAAAAPRDAKPQKRQRKPWVIVLLAAGSPVWASLLIAVLAVALAVVVSLWTVTVSLWAIFASLAVCVPAGIALCVGFLLAGDGPLGLSVLAASMVCAGLAVFCFFGCKAATKGILWLTKWLARCIRDGFRKREGA